MAMARTALIAALVALLACGASARRLLDGQDMVYWQQSVHLMPGAYTRICRLGGAPFALIVFALGLASSPECPTAYFMSWEWWSSVGVHVSSPNV
jgi:hypothetical protein